jgi:IS30 family transposase
VAQRNVEVIIQQYRDQNMPLREIARRHATSHETIRQVLKSAGIDRRPLHEWCNVSAEDIQDLRKHEEMTMREIAEHFGVSQQTLYRRLGGNY